MSARAQKVCNIQEAAERGWRPDGRVRKASPPPRVAPEVLLRSQLFLVERADAAQSRPRPDSRRSVVDAHYPRISARTMPLTIGPEARMHQSLWRRQDKYYAAILLGLALLVWWNPF